MLSSGRAACEPPAQGGILDLAAPLLLVSELFPPAIGGSAVLFDEIYSRLRGGPVRVLTDAVTSASAANSHRGLRVDRDVLATPQWGFRGSHALGHHLYVAGRIRHLARSVHSVVHCGRALPEGVAAWFSRLAAGPRYVCWSHGEDAATALTSRELSFVTRRVYGLASAILANSRNTERLLCRMGIMPAKIHVVHPGVDPGRFTPAVDGRALRDRFAPDGEVLMLSVGRLQRRKGHDLALEALGLLRDELPNLRYVIVGDGEERARLEHLTQARGLTRRVIFTGPVPAADLPRYYAACDFFIMPNRIEGNDLEGFGIVFLEAAASGKPAIAGETGGAPEAVANRVTGLLVSGTDRWELVSAIRRLARSSRLRARMGAAGRERVLRSFTWERAAAAVAAVHNQVSQRGAWRSSRRAA